MDAGDEAHSCMGGPDSERGDGGSLGDTGPHVINFNVSSINIRNQLLKHAASAYLQSAIVVPPRERDCLSRPWRRLLLRHRCRILLWPCGCVWPWSGCLAGDLAHRCAVFVAGSAHRLAVFLSRYVACMWT
ncbi:uncharacterized protein LOC133902063 [Phragmites australis]|uniref:uncharacterized protein LOC133902063 n=1 Tax=Phragmites australis TaxID=29695 RepID=UPI002D76BA7F|nr:uncharacterized protein LOC133902063 [Phragmites australis]